MKHFDPVELSPSACRRELAEFKALLDRQVELSEDRDILPFFRQHRALAGFIGTLGRSIAAVDRLAFEYDLWGDFSCDMIVGESRRRLYTLVEFEDARQQSIFRKGGRATPDWATRFERGYSQIVDWLWKLDDQHTTRDFRDRFGDGDVEFVGLLVVGRTQFLNDTDRRRLRWRLNKVWVNTFKIACMTLDDLHNEIQQNLNTIEDMARRPD